MRPKDEQGRLLPPPHERLPEAPRLRQVGVFAMADDRRSVIMTTARKIGFLNNVIDHVVDGDAIPKRVYEANPDDPQDHFLVDLWRLAEKAVRAEWDKVKPAKVRA